MIESIPMREMTLEEYVRELPEAHRARKEYEKLQAEIKRKDVILRFIKIRAEKIQTIDYGWDGDCGAKRQAEFIEDLADKALSKEE